MVIRCTSEGRTNNYYNCIPPLPLFRDSFLVHRVLRSRIHCYLSALSKTAPEGATAEQMVNTQITCIIYGLIMKGVQSPEMALEISSVW